MKNEYNLVSTTAAVKVTKCIGPSINNTICINLLNLREPASPRMTVIGFFESVQNCSRTGENASLLLSNCRETTIWNH